MHTTKMFQEFMLPTVTVIAGNGTVMKYQGFWKGFRPERDFAFWHDLLPKSCTKAEIRVLGPFLKGMATWRRNLIHPVQGDWDFFITGENRDNLCHLAHKNIGFRPPRTRQEIRFPYWQWYLSWPGYEVLPVHERFGERLQIDQMMQSIDETHGSVSIHEFHARSLRAVMLTSHFKRHRKRLLGLCAQTLGCDVFGRKTRKPPVGKKELLSRYFYNLCPENAISPGYVTEKVPEAFLSGCIPLAYCHPDDILLDFNPEAIVNLYGLTDSAIRDKLNSLKEYSVFSAYRSQPLLLKKPDFSRIIHFLE